MWAIWNSGKALNFWFDMIYRSWYIYRYKLLKFNWRFWQAKIWCHYHIWLYTHTNFPENDRVRIVMKYVMCYGCYIYRDDRVRIVTKVKILCYGCHIEILDVSVRYCWWTNYVHQGNKLKSCHNNTVDKLPHN